MYYLVPDVWELFLKCSRSFSRNQSGICFHLSSLNKSLDPDGLSSLVLSSPAPSQPLLFLVPPLELKTPWWCWREKENFKLKGFLTVLNQYSLTLKKKISKPKKPASSILATLPFLNLYGVAQWVLLLLSSGDTMIPLFAHVLEHRSFQTRIKTKT